MLQRIPDGLFLFGRTLGMLSVLRLGLVVALPLDDTVLLFDLCDIQAGHIQAVFSLYPLFYLGIGCTAGQVDFFRWLIVQVDMFAAFFQFHP